MNKNLKFDGIMTIENMPQVVELLRQLLNGEKYTFSAINESRPGRPDVRSGQSVAPDEAASGDAFNMYYDKESPCRFAGFNVVDTYGVWGCHTSPNEQPRFLFDGSKVKIEQLNGYQEKLIWLISVDKK